ncbi:hypothetical protein [Bradyrhizobium iriomotense]|uniref:hypothetical protein n=1 Tax=Bradyrhizobium iriomotense TaxID=441950 RepID=UPI001B8A13F0|nr:hypothetical protein [Bradyrhizobium iriomotense]MBR1128203.1 hypothetical protein [Bradyrhizobium iriomotense]
MIRASDRLHRYRAGWFAVMAQRGSLQALASLPSATTPTLRKKVLLLAARLRRLFNAWAAASIAHQAASAARQPCDHPATRGMSSSAARAARDA